MEQTTYDPDKTSTMVVIDGELRWVLDQIIAMQGEVQQGADGGYFSWIYMEEKIERIRDSMNRIEGWARGVADDD